MRKNVCGNCGSEKIHLLSESRKCYCESCKRETSVCVKSESRLSPYERCKARVYATGNRWAIENWNATHN